MTRRLPFTAGAAHAHASLLRRHRAAQQPAAPAGPQPFTVGNRLGMPIAPAPDGKFDPMSTNVKVYGAIYSAESCSYDPGARRHRGAQPRRGAERPDQQRLDLLHQPRRVGAHGALGRHSEPG